MAIDQDRRDRVDALTEATYILPAPMIPGDVIRFAEFILGENQEPRFITPEEAARALGIRLDDDPGGDDQDEPIDADTERAPADLRGRLSADDVCQVCTTPHRIGQIKPTNQEDAK